MWVLFEESHCKNQQIIFALVLEFLSLSYTSCRNTVIILLALSSFKVFTENKPTLLILNRNSFFGSVCATKFIIKKFKIF